MNRRSVAEHASKVAELLRHLDDLPGEDVAVTAALDRLLATDVTSPIDMPVFRNSAMDGYAVDAASITTAPVSLAVRGTIAAGAVADRHVAGTAVRIMTGAPVPDGADCVVPVEETSSTDGQVTVERARAAGDFIREPGTDIATGALLVPAGTLLAPRHIAALAAVGIESVPVRRKPRAAVVTTGDELVPAGKPLQPGQIYDSNGTALAAALEANGAEIVSVEHSTDDPAELRRLLSTVSADFVVTSGGISMGDFEVVKEALQPLGGEFGPVAIQPGGPQGLSVVDGLPVLSFPGNPVSTLVSFEIFLRPVVRRAAGLPDVPTAELPIAADLTSIAGRRQFLRGRRTGTGVELASGSGSHLIASMAAADVLIDIPAEVTAIEAGQTVRVWTL